MRRGNQGQEEREQAGTIPVPTPASPSPCFTFLALLFYLHLQRSWKYSTFSPSLCGALTQHQPCATHGLRTQAVFWEIA